MGQGLNLRKMSDYISTNKIKSSPHAMMHSGSQNQFKMKIDTFQDKIKVKKFHVEEGDDAESGRFLHNTLSK